MKPITISILIAGLLIGGAIFFSNKPVWDTNEEITENVTVENGVQFIDIKAKGGYFPRTTYAQAGVETVLRIETNNTFDCSSALVIPALGYRANLQPSGVEEIPLSLQKAGDNYRGLCSMGMYGFEIRFVDKID